MEDSPQARGLIAGLSGVSHEIVDAAYDEDHLRNFIADDLKAKAHIKRNLTQREDRPIDWSLYKESHLVECFCNKINWFRRIALRCKKTLTSFKAFVDIAGAMAWVAKMQTLSWDANLHYLSPPIGKGSVRFYQLEIEK